MKGINTAIVEFKEDLAKLINTSGLPPAIVDLVLAEFKQANVQYVQKAIEVEREEVNKDGSIPEEKLGE
jgi:hypothetical protein